MERALIDNEVSATRLVVDDRISLTGQQGLAEATPLLEHQKCIEAPAHYQKDS